MMLINVKECDLNMTTDGSPDKVKAIDLAIAQIEKQYGKGAIMRLGEDQAPVKVDAIP